MFSDSTVNFWTSAPSLLERITNTPVASSRDLCKWNFLHVGFSHMKIVGRNLLVLITWLLLWLTCLFVGSREIKFELIDAFKVMHGELLSMSLNDPEEELPINVQSVLAPPNEISAPWPYTWIILFARQHTSRFEANGFPAFRWHRLHWSATIRPYRWAVLIISSTLATAKYSLCSIHFFLTGQLELLFY